MASIVKEELAFASSSNTIDELNGDIEVANNMSEVIDVFVDNTVTLTGEAWNAVRTKLKSYQTALANISNVSTILSEAIDKALKELLDYIEPYDSLDTKDLAETQEQLKIANNSIDSITAQMNSRIPTKIKDKNGKETTTYASLAESDPGLYDSLNADLRTAKALVIELNKKIEKINGLEVVYNKVKAELDEAFASVQELTANISQIIPTKEYIYR